MDKGTKSLNDLDMCIVLMQDTENISKNILTQLDNQEEKINLINKKSIDMKTPLNKSGYVLSNMIKRDKRKTIIQIIVIILCIIISILLVVLIAKKN